MRKLHVVFVLLGLSVWLNVLSTAQVTVDIKSGRVTQPQQPATRSADSPQASKKLTNQDVISMVSLGLSDGVIIDKIRSAGASEFDTSVAGLGLLKANKVSDAVIQFMINPRPVGTGSRPTLPTASETEPTLTVPTASRTDPHPTMPTGPGFYVLVEDKYQSLSPAPIQSVQPKVGRAILNAYSFGLAGNRVVIIIPGKRSPVQTGPRPTFLLVNAHQGIASSVHGGGLNPRALQVLKLDEKGKHREVNIMHGTSWNPSIGLPDAKWPFTVTAISDTAYQFTLPSDLPSGEYVVLSGMIANGYNGFDFTVGK